MALSRKMLLAMDIPAEKVDEIIAAHVETTSALKEQIEGVTATAADLAKANAKIAELQKAVDDANAAGWEKKYNETKAEFDTYKSDIEKKAVRGAKESAYKQLLVDAGISEKRIGSIMKLSDIDGVSLDKEGKIKDAEKLTESIKSEWADFIVTEGTKGAETPKPAESTGGTPPTPSRAAQLVAQYRSEHYGTKEE